MNNFSYSVVIRTLGNTGEMYHRLLVSIANQTIQPEEIIVAIPNGYTLDYTIGNERIIRCQKGMTVQRACGILAVKSDYMLVVDDDVEFDSTMIENLYEYLQQNQLDCCLPMEGDTVSQTDKTIDLFYPLTTRLRSAFTGQMFTSRRKSKYLDILTFAAGHKVFVKSNDLDTCYLCTTACFQCFFIKTSMAQSAHFENELWLDEGRYHYAAFDEPVFFSKLNQNGLRMAYALRVRYKHLDAKIGHPCRSKLDDKCVRYYTIGRNRSIYWYKCIWKPQQNVKAKAHALIGGLYSLINFTLWTITINAFKPKYWKAIMSLFAGYRDAYEYIRSN